jgi:hypothetical protein
MRLPRHKELSCLKVRDDSAVNAIHGLSAIGFLYTRTEVRSSRNPVFYNANKRDSRNGQKIGLVILLQITRLRESMNR